jgi:F-box protein 11
MSGAISAAIQRSQPGDTVRLRSGLYVESVLVDRPVNIVADAPGQVVIQSLPQTPCLQLAADAVVQGITLSATGTKLATAVQVIAGQPRLENCDIESPVAAIVADQAQTGFVLRGCRLHQAGVAIQLSNGAQGIMADCEVTEVRLFAIVLERQAAIQAYRCRISHTKLGGVVVQQDSRAEFEQCEFAGNPAEAERQNRYLDAQLQLTGGKLELRDCWLHDGQGCGVALQKGGHATLTNCRITGHAMAGIQIGDQCLARLNGGHIANNRGAGILVMDGGQLIAMEIDVRHNQAAGVAALRGGAFEVNASRINGNMVGVGASEQAGGVVANSDLTGNTRGPIIAQTGCSVQCHGTQI